MLTYLRICEAECENGINTIEKVLDFARAAYVHPGIALTVGKDITPANDKAPLRIASIIAGVVFSMILIFTIAVVSSEILNVPWIELQPYPLQN